MRVFKFVLWLSAIGAAVLFVVPTDTLPFRIRMMMYDIRWLVSPPSVESYVIDKRNKVDRLIAHAGGAVRGFTYTNSLEALEENYRKGFRLFELDLIKTNDGHIVAAHDWAFWKKITGFRGEIPPSLHAFKAEKIYGRFTPLDIESIDRWLRCHPDAVLVTDKLNDPKEIAEHITDTKRVMMELFDWEAVFQAQRVGITPMPTWSIVKKLSFHTVPKLQRLGIRHVALSIHDVGRNPRLMEALYNAGIKTYAFNLEDITLSSFRCQTYGTAYGYYLNGWEDAKVVLCR